MVAELPSQLLRKILVKRRSKSSSRYGCRPEKRPINELLEQGFVILDKPAGPTSHQVSSYVKAILKAKKAGHSGTLDPGVTGVLPIALNRATRIVQVLLPAGKEYVGVAHFHRDVSVDTIKKAFKKFVGPIEQLPPRISAVKRRPRIKRIYYLDVLEIEQRDVLFRIGCEAGLYVRKLVHDIGEYIGCRAHMAELRRTKVGPLDESKAVTLHDIADAFWFWKNEKNERFLRYCVRPIEEAVQHLAKVWVLDSAVDALCHGASLAALGISKLSAGIKKGDAVALLTLKGELIGLGTALASSEQMLKVRHGIVVRLRKVFMKRGTYPSRKSFHALKKKIKNKNYLCSKRPGQYFFSVSATKSILIARFKFCAPR